MKAWEPGWAIAVTTWTMGVNVRAASWPHMGGYRRLSKGQLPLG